MSPNRFYSYTLLFLLVLLGYLTYRIMSPFLNVIAWSVVFSILFFPVYAYILKIVRMKAVASLITVILLLLVIIGPFTYVTFMLVEELKGLSLIINENNIDSFQELLERIKTTALFNKIGTYTGLEGLLSDTALRDNINKMGKMVMENLSVRITNIIFSLIDFVFIVFTTFFLLKDGSSFLSKAKDYMPFDEDQKRRLDSQVKDMIVSTVFGGVVIAVVQGMLGGFGFYFSGIESPAIWGVVMSIMSFVPVVGTFSVWGPASVYLVFQGDFFHGAGLFLFGVLVISSVDNILKPLIIGSRTKIHTVIILFSVLGGIKLFGMIGLIMGPLITAVFISVFEIFRNIETTPASGVQG